MTSYDRNFNRGGEVFLSLCGNDPFCVNKLGLDPVNTVEYLFQEIDEGT